MKIVIVIHSLGGGGAERAAVLIAQGLVTKKYQVSLITLFGQEFDFYHLPENVPRIALKVEGSSANLLQAAKNNLHRLQSLRRAIDSCQPDVVISFLDKTNVLTLIACLGSKYPLIVSEQNDPTQNDIGLIWNFLRRLVYPFATTVVSCSQGVDRNWNWLNSQQRAVIYNPLAVKTLELEAVSIQLDPNQKQVVAMGRLTPQKGFDLLLKAFSMINTKFFDWQLIILGEGEQRNQLEQLAQELEIEQQVMMPGLVSNPFPILKQCDLFVLSSRYEGFGNVIIEAMACGLPVISTDCPSGPGEIIISGDNGILVPNQEIDSLAKAMADLMSNPERRQKLSKNAHLALSKFELDVIVNQWQKLLIKCKIVFI
jgi:GalNAc-alpha-(1->4)-GalNAc-alpha-(1->3)-diNAcBac-PP-undecaprenol alpha-1,4-N-acetyl-D-galactosaminyltransferase